MFLPYDIKALLEKDFEKAKINNPSIPTNLVNYMINFIFSQEGIKLIKCKEDILNLDLDFCSITAISIDKEKLNYGRQYYKEFKELVNKASRAEKQDKEILKLEEKLENRDERKALDSIVEVLFKANDSKTTKQKQAYIRECLEIYCNTFNIPIEELLR